MDRAQAPSVARSQPALPLVGWVWRSFERRPSAGACAPRRLVGALLCDVVLRRRKVLSGTILPDPSTR